MNRRSLFDITASCADALEGFLCDPSLRSGLEQGQVRYNFFTEDEVSKSGTASVTMLRRCKRD
jgi:hypothetical protein